MRRQSAMHACMTHLAMPDGRSTLHVQFRRAATVSATQQPVPVPVPVKAKRRPPCVLALPNSIRLSNGALRSSSR